MSNRKYKRVSILIVIFFVTLLLSIFKHYLKVDVHNCIDENTIVLRLAEIRSSDHPSTKGVNEFARLVRQRSNEKIQIIVYDSGKLGDERSVIEQVQFGGIDFARIDMFSINEFSKDISLFAIPYAIKNLKHMWDVMDSQVGVNIKKDLLKERFKCMCVYEPSSRCFYTCRHKIKSIKDLKGLKIRTQQSKSIVDVMDNIGIKSVFLGEDSIYDSIEEGLIDGAEDNVVMYYKSRNYEIAKFAMIDNHFRIPEMIIANKVTMSGLSKEDQELIEQAAKDSARLEQCLIRIQEKKAINYMLRSGVTIKNIDDKSKEEFIRNNKQYYENFDKKRINYILGRIKE